MKKLVFSVGQEVSIRTIVREELIPICHKLAEHDEKLNNLPTRSDMLDMFDKYLGAYNRLDTEVTVLSGISDRHEKEIKTIKKYMQLA